MKLEKESIKLLLEYIKLKKDNTKHLLDYAKHL